MNLRLQGLHGQSGNGSNQTRLEYSQKVLNAEQEMLHKTWAQGQEYLNAHINKKVKEVVPESWRMVGKIIYPKWYYQAWEWIYKAITRSVLFVLIVISFIPNRLIGIISGKIRRGFTTVKVQPTEKKFVMGILIYRFFQLVYQGEMDVRNGVLTNEFQAEYKAPAWLKWVLLWAGFMITLSLILAVIR